VEGLKRASKEPTTGKSAESVEEVKQAESPVADVKMEVADEVKDAVVREGKAEAAVAEIAGSDEVAADVRTGEGGNQAVSLP